MPQTEAAKKYVEWLGGEDVIIKKAKESYNKGEYRWVAEVLKNVVFANPNNQQAKNLQADAFEQLAYQSESGIWRDLYLSGAKELREGVPAAKNNLPGAAYKFLSGLTPEAIFDYLSIAIDGTKAAGKDITLRFIFPELHKNIFVVASDEQEAKRKAVKQVNEWESPHRDYLHQVDVTFELNKFLAQDNFYLHLKENSNLKPFEFICRYTPIG